MAETAYEVFTGIQLFGQCPEWLIVSFFDNEEMTTAHLGILLEEFDIKNSFWKRQIQSL